MCRNQTMILSSILGKGCANQVQPSYQGLIMSGTWCQDLRTRALVSVIGFSGRQFCTAFMLTHL